jgi:hypothetical protein
VPLTSPPPAIIIYDKKSNGDIMQQLSTSNLDEHKNTKKRRMAKQLGGSLKKKLPGKNT